MTAHRARLTQDGSLDESCLGGFGRSCVGAKFGEDLGQLVGVVVDEVGVVCVSGLEDASGDVGVDGERVGCAHGDEKECGGIEVGVNLAGVLSALQCGDLLLEAFVALVGVGVVVARAAAMRWRDDVV